MLEAEIQMLREKIAEIEAERERERRQLSETVDDLRRRLDSEGVERRALMALITDQREKDLGRIRSFGSWFWRRKPGN